MFLMYPHFHGPSRPSKVHLVNETGGQRKIAGCVCHAVEWLLARGEARVGVPVGDQVAIHLIEDVPAPGKHGPFHTLRTDPAAGARGAAFRRRLGDARWRAILRHMGPLTDVKLPGH